jgi:hypothetical protein
MSNNSFNHPNKPIFNGRHYRPLINNNPLQPVLYHNYNNFIPPNQNLNPPIDNLVPDGQQQIVENVKDIGSFIKKNFEEKNNEPSRESNEFNLDNFLANFSKNTANNSAQLPSEKQNPILPIEINPKNNLSFLIEKNNNFLPVKECEPEMKEFNAKEMVNENKPSQIINYNNNFNFSNIVIESKEEITQCLCCQWQFPQNFTINEKNAHIDRCFEGMGEQDKANYHSSVNEVNQLDIIEKKSNKEKVDTIINESFLCIVCRKFRNSDMNILEKHINDCLEQQSESEKLTGKKRKSYKIERFDPEECVESKTFFKKKFK